MKNFNECPNEIEEIFQGEDLLIEGCVYDDNEEALDLKDYSLVADISSRESIACRFASDSEDEAFRITKEADKGVFSFVVPASRTSVMRGNYFIAIKAVDPNGNLLISGLYSAFEVRSSKIGSNK